MYYLEEKDMWGVRAQDNHNFLHAVFWILKTGTTWRDWPQRYGDWTNGHRRFSRWVKRGVFDKLLQALTDEEQTKLLLLDSSVVGAHQQVAKKTIWKQTKGKKQPLSKTGPKNGETSGISSIKCYT